MANALFRAKELVEQYSRPEGVDPADWPDALSALVAETERLRAKYVPPYAAKMLDVRPETLTPFEERDPFNPQNIVSGYLCHQADHRYGALVILQVNGQDCEQIVYATPKLHYPFAKDAEQNTRRYHWPVCQEGAVYEKLDGTNVCVFSYANHRGERFASAKVRLGAFLRNGKFGAFIDMWREMVKQNGFAPPPEVVSGDVALSFEMYGYRNLITVKYPFPLKITLLFGVRQKDASPIVVEECPLRPEDEALRNPRIARVANGADLTVTYEAMRADAASKCFESQTDEGKLEGTEGYVLYLLTDDKRFVSGGKRWTLWKIKPELVEGLHWTNDTPSYKTILPTVWNALETMEPDKLDFDALKPLLEEEFAAAKVEEARALVEKAIREVQQTLKFRADVKRLFEESPDKTDKRTLMRYLSQHFPREEMKKVYTSLVQQGLWKVDAR